MRGLARILFKKFGWGAVLYFIGVLGIIFAVRDSEKNIGGHWSVDFTVDIAVTAGGFILGTIAFFFRIKRLEKERAAAEEIAAREAEKAKSDPKNWNKPRATAQTAPVSDEAQIKGIIEKARRTSPDLPMVKFVPYLTETDIFDSKIGGVPYMPKDFTYPTVKEGERKGKPLKFLAQLNFNELPHIPDFPERGILQFFCGCDDSPAYGMNFDDYTDQNEFRVIYHENVITDRSKLMSREETTTPSFGEYLLKAETPLKCSVTPQDYRFEYPADAPEDIMIKIFDKPELSNENICMGGYPFFNQNDPRGNGNKLHNHNILLFQLSYYDADDFEIIWDDMGVGNFFITPEALRARDFSNVIYSWDCS